MSTWTWIVIAVAALIVLAIVLWGVQKGRERRLESKREEASNLRQQAETKAQRAEHRSSVADELSQRATVEREEAQVAARRADEVDPDVDE
jgi:flagellar biosynthesis/type III secretory pathway M-ring protein FliF/YscJ